MKKFNKALKSNLKIFTIFLFIALAFTFNLFTLFKELRPHPQGRVKGLQATNQPQSYWLNLHRKSNLEYLYLGIPGNPTKSFLIKTFIVKVGIPGQRPTPLPELLGRSYWVIDDEFETPDNPETAPYFLKLNIPYTEEFPFGPEPYLECNGQCDWVLPGSFGLHGVGGDLTKLSSDNPGSSGCIRHSDEDIAYLYNLLDPKKSEIRYYIEDI